MKPVETVSYKGYKIRVYPDPDVESPDSWGNTDLFLITTRNRYFQVERDGFTMDAARDGEYSETYEVFPLYAYIHSGVALSVSRGGQFSDQWDSGQIGFVFVDKKRGFEDQFKAAESLCEEWNDYLAGHVYGYTLHDEHGEEIDACWGYYGNYDQYLVPEVKADIDRRIQDDEDNPPAGDIPVVRCT